MARFSTTLEGESRVFGIKFRPGGFRGVLGGPVTAITDRAVALSGVYEFDAEAAEAKVLGAADDMGMMEVAEDFLRTRMPAADETVDLVHGIVERIANDRTLNRVDELAEQLGLGERALQRLFNDYVGVTPKWVIRRSPGRYRSSAPPWGRRRSRASRRGDNRCCRSTRPGRCDSGIRRLRDCRCSR